MPQTLANYMKLAMSLVDNLRIPPPTTKILRVLARGQLKYDILFQPFSYTDIVKPISKQAANRLAEVPQWDMERPDDIASTCTVRILIRVCFIPLMYIY